MEHGERTFAWRLPRALGGEAGQAGFAVSTGSACSSGKEAPSHVLTAMGVDAHETDRVVRFSSGWETTAEDWQALAKGVHTVGQELTD